MKTFLRGTRRLLPLTLRGLIALQVHQIGDGTKKPAGEEIRWRNLRLKEL